MAEAEPARIQEPAHDIAILKASGVEDRAALFNGGSHVVEFVATSSTVELAVATLYLHCSLVEQPQRSTVTYFLLLSKNLNSSNLMF
jgi:hypothetical protein